MRPQISLLKFATPRKFDLIPLSNLICQFFLIHFSGSSNVRVNPTAQDNYAVRLASETGSANIVKVLLRNVRENPTAQDNYAVRLASENVSLSVVRALLEDVRVDFYKKIMHYFRQVKTDIL